MAPKRKEVVVLECESMLCCVFRVNIERLSLNIIQSDILKIILFFVVCFMQQQLTLFYGLIYVPAGNPAVSGTITGRPSGDA